MTTFRKLSNLGFGFGLDLTTFRKLSNLRLRFRFDNFLKVVKSEIRIRFDNFSKVVKSGIRIRIRFDNFSKVVKSEIRIRIRFDNFSKVVKSEIRIRFDNFSKVVKSGIKKVVKSGIKIVSIMNNLSAQSSALYSKYFLTTDHFQKMVEAGIFDDTDHIELVEGELISMVPINPPHAGKTGRLHRLLSRRVGDLALVYAQTPIILDHDSEPQPDIVVARPRPDFYETSHPGPPDILLLVEVSNTTAKYDRTVKIPLYAHAGIPEVWLVDLLKARVEVYLQPQTDGYRQVLFPNNQESLTLSQLPAVSISLAELWN